MNSTVKTDKHVYVKLENKSFLRVVFPTARVQVTPMSSKDYEMFDACVSGVLRDTHPPLVLGRPIPSY